MNPKLVFDRLVISLQSAIRLAVAGALFVQLEAATPYRYRIVDLSSTGMRGAAAINNLGHVLGSSAEPSYHLLLWDRQQTVNLGTGPGVTASGLDLNDDDVAVGFLSYPSSTTHAMRFSNGVMTDVAGGPEDEIARAINNAGNFVTDNSVNSYFHTPTNRSYIRGLIGLIGTRAEDINESSQVAGTAVRPLSDRVTYRAFIWAAGQMQDLGTLGGRHSFGTAMNDAGMVVGAADLGNATSSRHPFVASAGRMIDLGKLLPDPKNIWLGNATAINNFGVVVGESALAFVWYGGKRLELNAYTDRSGTPFENVFNPVEINDRGEILASGDTPLGVKPVLLVPIPTDGVPGHLVNISVRASAGSGESTCIVGFVVAGGEGHALIRGVGPGLQSMGLPGAVANPLITLYRGGTQIGRNDDWGASANVPELAAAAVQLGAFSLTDGSGDAAILTSLAAGSYSAHATATAGGVVLAEIYDAVPDTEHVGRIVNLSARVEVGTGDQIGIAGFVVAGDGPCKLLIRGIGPGLKTLGVSNVLADPQLWLYTSDGRPVLGNEDWGTAAGFPLMAKTTDEVGAFALQDGSKDAALLVQLEPGVYSVHVSGADGGTGVALVEVYLVP